jgi:hypothetical protein
MADHAQTFKIILQKVTAQVTPEVMREATRHAANTAIDMIQKRTERGIGVDGSPFMRRQPKYLIAKAKRMRRFSGRFAAGSANDWLRLSGGTFRAMAVKNIRVRRTGRSIEATAELYIKGSKEQRKVEGIERRRKFWGLSRSGTAERAREDREMLRAMRAVLRVRAGKGVVITG